MSDEKEISSSDKLLECMDHFLSQLNMTSATSHELEIGFGGEGRDKYISKTTFNNVINNYLF